MTIPTIFTDTRKVLLSGSLLTLENEETTFEFPLLEGSMFFKIRFVSDIKTEQNMKTVKIDDRTLLLELTNFDFPMGTGNVSPLKIGQIDGKEISLNIFVRKMSHDIATRELIYTFYIEK